jgi:hypothetical protein
LRSPLEEWGGRDRTEDITTTEESLNSDLHMCMIGGWDKKDTREIKSEAAQHSAATAEGDMMEINRVDEESVMNNTTEVV